MTQPSDNGIKDVKDTPKQPDTPSPYSPAAQEIALLLAMQKQEWQQLRSEAGVILRFINLQEPETKRRCLVIVIGTQTDDIIGNDTTLDVFVNGLSIDAIVQIVAEKRMAQIKDGTNGENGTPEP